MSIDEDEIKQIEQIRRERLEQARLDNPIGTKFLIEVEIVDADGYNSIVDAMFAPEKGKNFQELTGCSISTLYKKEIKVATNSNTLENIVEQLMRKTNELKSIGVY